MSRLVSLAGLALSAASLSPTAALGLEGAAVVPPGEHLAVVQVGSRCTGALVGPQTVIYAAHCGDGPTMVRVGPLADGRHRDVRASRCVAHPDGGPGSRWDVALCFLDEPLREVLPVRLGRPVQSVRIDTRASLSVVAFGASAVSPFGVKRVGTVTVTQVEPYLSIDGPASACEGDSGGPLFLRSGAPEGDVVVGIVSATTSQNCDGSPTRAVRMHDVQKWLEATMAANAPERGDPPRPSGGAPLPIPAVAIIGAIALAIGAGVAMRRQG
ncbi:MAG: hypothetical protein AMXMBFR58_37930 [Phycisphaerae bacterium]